VNSIIVPKNADPIIALKCIGWTILRDRRSAMKWNTGTLFFIRIIIAIIAPYWYRKITDMNFFTHKTTYTLNIPSQIQLSRIHAVVFLHGMNFNSSELVVKLKHWREGHPISSVTKIKMFLQCIKFFHY